MIFCPSTRAVQQALCQCKISCLVGTWYLVECLYNSRKTDDGGPINKFFLLNLETRIVLEKIIA